MSEGLTGAAEMSPAPVSFGFYQDGYGEALAAVLAHTRWTVGDVDVGATERGCLLYHVNALAARDVARGGAGDRQD